MRTATTIEASGLQRWRDGRDFVVEAEKLGLDICSVAEAWGPCHHCPALPDRRQP